MSVTIDDTHSKKALIMSVHADAPRASMSHTKLKLYFHDETHTVPRFLQRYPPTDDLRINRGIIASVMLTTRFGLIAMLF